MSLDDVLAAIDDANHHDPNLLDGEPLARKQGQLATAWLAKLAPEASPELQLVVRAHHLRRWELARSDFDDGRDGYLRWRRENKAHQANALASIMEDHQQSPQSIERVRTLLARTKLRSDAETQTLEDAACLVFLETQFEPMVERLEHAHMVDVVAKTLKKMSAVAIALAGSIDLGPASQAVLADAAVQLSK